MGDGERRKSSERQAVIGGALQTASLSMSVTAGLLGGHWGIVYVGGALWLFAAAYTAHAGVRWSRERRHEASPETEETG
ncbi:hypothetical protein [Nocardiopsis trehalosi]|uniref:hypothetical protein n=1 Tax=Nocardiopsis trehalosi TaxID=109329 RepID=UPI00082ABC21|nr:hypothetical protein [Nocardiopsis trehalosi]